MGSGDEWELQRGDFSRAAAGGDNLYGLDKGSLSPTQFLEVDNA